MRAKHINAAGGKVTFSVGAILCGASWVCSRLRKVAHRLSRMCVRRGTRQRKRSLSGSASNYPPMALTEDDVREWLGSKARIFERAIEKIERLVRFFLDDWGATWDFAYEQIDQVRVKEAS